MDDQGRRGNEEDRTCSTGGETQKDNCPDIPCFQENPAIPEMPQAGQCLTLEQIVDRTGEIEHLNELIVLNLEKAGGFTSAEDYLVMVAPILDLLEVEIRVRYRPGMTTKEMKLIVQDWIDAEIACIRSGKSL